MHSNPESNVSSQTQTDLHLNINESLDARGLNCPLPILKTKVLLNKMRPGEIVYVQATDPHSVIDFEAYCARTNHELLRIIENDGLYEFYIRRTQNPKKF